MGKRGSRHHRFSKEEKLKYVKLHLEEHVSLLELERQYGIQNGLIATWVRRYLEEGEESLEPHNGNPYTALHTSKSLSEVERLRLVVAKQAVEIARLKRGIGWKKLVQTRSTLLAAKRVRGGRRTQSEISSKLSL